jgi:hypothetical protein
MGSKSKKRMTQKRFEQLRKQHLASVWKRIDLRLNLFETIETASNPADVRTAAIKFYDECQKLDRALASFISRLKDFG